MFKMFLKYFSKEIGIDLGTSKTIFYVKNKGIVVHEPTVVALNTKTNQILAVGKEALLMLGKTPPHIAAIRPLNGGVISDFEITEKLLRYFIDKVKDNNILNNLINRPRVVISIPCGGTEVEKRAVEDVVKNVGASEIYLVEGPIAIAIGARLPIKESGGILVVDIGGGATEIAVISLGGVVVSKSLRIAGNKLNEDIIYYIRDKFKLAIGEQTAEEVKIVLGSALDLGSDQEMKIKGRDLTRGLPKEIKIKESEVREAFSESLEKIISAIKGTIEITPPELITDIMKEGILLSGGTSLLRGLNKLIASETSLPVKIIDDPLTVVARGTGIILEEINAFKDILVDLKKEKQII